MSRSKFFVSLRNKKIAFKIYNLKSCPHTSLSLFRFPLCLSVVLFGKTKTQIKQTFNHSGKRRQQKFLRCAKLSHRPSRSLPPSFSLPHSFSPFRPSFKKPTAKFAAPLCLCPGYIFVVDWINKQPVKAVTQWRHTAWASLVEGESVQG